MDGTLVEAEQLWGEAMAALAVHLGGWLTDAPVGVVSRSIHHGPSHVSTSAVSGVSGAAGISPPAVVTGLRLAEGCCRCLYSVATVGTSSPVTRTSAVPDR